MAASIAKKVYRFFKKIGLFGHSKKMNLFGVHPILISTLFILLSLALASLLRKLVKLSLSDNVFRKLVLEFIATVELCAACFELIVVADNWGVWTYALFLFLLTLWWEQVWEEATACSYSPVEDVLEGKRDMDNAALIIFSQIMGALVTYTYIQIIWAMELVETHKGKAFEACSADLQVNMFVGAAIEAIGTCVCRLIGRILTDGDARFASFVSAFFSTMMVVAAFNYSGGYFNPALATSLKLGCEGNTFIEHVVVYWLGATVGSVASVYLFRSQDVQNYVKSIKEKSE